MWKTYISHIYIKKERTWIRRQQIGGLSERLEKLFFNTKQKPLADGGWQNSKTAPQIPPHNVYTLIIPYPEVWMGPVSIMGCHAPDILTLIWQRDFADVIMIPNQLKVS